MLMAEKFLQPKLTLGEMTDNGREKIVRHVWAVSLWGTRLNLPRVRFKRCGGSKQAVLREKNYRTKRKTTSD